MSNLSIGGGSGAFGPKKLNQNTIGQNAKDAVSTNTAGIIANAGKTSDIDQYLKSSTESSVADSSKREKTQGTSLWQGFKNWCKNVKESVRRYFLPQESAAQKYLERDD